MKAHIHSIICCTLAASMVIVTACDGTKSTSPRATQFSLNPCNPSATLTLNVATAALVDCSGGGTTQTLAGNGASYLIVPQFATDQGLIQNVSYKLFTANTGTAASMAAGTIAKHLMLPPMDGVTPDFRSAPRNMAAQRTMERALRARAAKHSLSMVIHTPSGPRIGAARSAIVAPPTLGSRRTFHVASSLTGNTFVTVGATVSYVGTNVIIYSDTLAPANGFTAPQFLAFGQLFDQTLYPIDTAAFGPPSDIDNNGRVIMLMSPRVNADTPASTCQTQGYVAGFFDSEDFNSSADPNSNQGEVFYSIVPDPNGQFSCAHSVSEVGAAVPGTFMHELQHLINWSQHVVVNGTAAPSSWLDEGLSIVAEELGSLYYEQKCPPPQCRTNPAQLFPDSAEAFAENFPFNSYQYALMPDTASITLSTDDSNGISWRGGVWLFARWLGDQYGSSIYRQLELGPANATTAIQQVTGKTFQSVFSNFGLSLYTDSLPGLARTTAPPANRFTSRNMRQIWARMFAIGGPSTQIPVVMPLQLTAITSDTTSAILVPGTMSFFRLDTPATAATVTIQFSTPAGLAFAPLMRAQLAVFRLPAGQ